MAKVSKLINSILRINTVRSIISIAMTIWVVKVLKRPIRIFDGDKANIADNTVKSNLRIINPKSNLPDYPDAKYFFGVGTNQGGVKADMLIEPINAVLAARLRDRSKCDVLSIGPRSYGEILNLRSHGYSPSKIRGVDLFSLFADIEVGDLHQLPFPDNHFDIVLCGWVLAYSENRELAAAEIKRVLRPGGMFSIGVSYSSESNEQQRERRGYLIGAENRIVSCKQVLGYFGDGISEIYFFVEPDKRLKHSQILVTGSVK